MVSNFLFTNLILLLFVSLTASADELPHNAVIMRETLVSNATIYNKTDLVTFKLHSTTTTPLIVTTTTSTTRTSTPSATTTTTSADTFTVSRKSNRIEEIKRLLKLDAIQKCSYEYDPYIIALCPHYSDALASQSNDTRVIENPDFLRLSDIGNALIYLDVVENLRSKCQNGEWCLGDNHTIYNNLTIGSYTMKQYGKSLCMLATCYDEMIDYVMHCSNSELLKSLFNMVPTLCKIYTENASNDYCLEETSKLVHITYATYYNSTNHTNNFGTNVCAENILSNKDCNNSCKYVAKKLQYLESCCHNSELIRSVKLFSWYFKNKTEVGNTCTLPITSLCWSSKGIYIEVNHTTLSISVVCSVVFILMLIMFVYLVFCRETQVLKVIHTQYYSNSYEYSQLYEANNCDDEIDNLYGNASVDNDYFLSTTTDFIENPLIKKIRTSGYNLRDTNHDQNERKSLIK